jgi:hypothetical protein
LTALDGQISTLTGLQNGDVANFTAIDDNFTTVAGQITTLENNTIKYPYLANVTSDIQTQIDSVTASSLPSLSYDSGSTTTTIANTTKVATMKFADLTEQVTGFSTALKASVLDNATKVAQNTTNISQNTSDILLKQNILNNTTNKLPIASVNLTGSNLQYADYGSSVNSKMSSIDSTLASQLTLNSSVSNDLTTLASGKQSLLNNSTNKLNPSFIDAGTASLTNTKMQYLGSITSDLQTQLTNKASSNNPTFTGEATMVSINLSNTLTSSKIIESIGSTFTTFSSNVLTHDYSSNHAILYFNGLTSNTNFQLALTTVSNSVWKSTTFTLLIDVSTFKAFADTCKINGSLVALRANGGLVNVDLTDITTGGLLMQQFTIMYTGSAVSPYKVITNISQYY